MNIFSILTLCGGLAFFLYGMHTMSKSLEKMAAMTVMLVGLVNSGVMELGQTIGVIMGSNIGTTLTAWILSLTGLQSENVWINLLKPENFSPAIALIGVILIMGGKKQKQRDVGRIMVGFSILMYGMQLMTSVGILQALALTGSISFGMAIPIIMGQNIGTCVTALISSIGVNRNAKQVAVVHISFNVIGTVICLTLFYGAHALIGFTFIDDPISAVGIAFCHTIFNVFTTALLLPFSRQLEKLARILVKSEDKSRDVVFLDPLLLRTPSVAISECVNKTNQMARLAHQNLLLSIEQFQCYSADREAAINANEDKLDIYEDRLGSYLVEVSRHNISTKDSRDVARLLHAINDFERIGDHALNLQVSAQELHDKKLSFSDEAKTELAVLTKALTDILASTFDCFVKNDAGAAEHIEPLEETIDRLIEEIRLRHIERLQTGRCTIQLGFVLNDLLTNFERVSDHCSNIAVCVIESREGVMDSHAYLHEVKAGSPTFNSDLRADLKQYTLPRL